jgi:uncharacterized integral membrane protein
MLLSLILGMFLGGLSVIFALQNTGSLSVDVLAWQVQAPVALVLLVSIASGAIASALAVLPRLIRDELLLASYKRQLRDAHDENAKHRLTKANVPTNFYDETVVHGPKPSIFG